MALVYEEVVIDLNNFDGSNHTYLVNGVCPYSGKSKMISFMQDFPSWPWTSSHRYLSNT